MQQTLQQNTLEDDRDQTPEGKSDHSYYLKKLDDTIEKRVNKAKTQMSKYPQNSAEPHKRRLFADSGKKKGVKTALKYSSLPRINEQTLDTFNNDVYMINKENGVKYPSPPQSKMSTTSSILSKLQNRIAHFNHDKASNRKGGTE